MCCFGSQPCLGPVPGVIQSNFFSNFTFEQDVPTPTLFLTKKEKKEKKKKEKDCGSVRERGEGGRGWSSEGRQLGIGLHLLEPRETRPLWPPWVSEPLIPTQSGPCFS